MKKGQRKIALFDMDGTLIDYHTVLKRDMEQIATADELDHKGEFKINLNWNHNLPAYLQARKRLITSQPDWWFNLPMLPAGFEILHLCEDIGYEIMILTKGPWQRESAWTEKVRWCKKYVPGAKVTVTEDKSLTYGRVLVDDYPDYVDGWLEYRPRGLVIMPKSSACDGYSRKNVVIYEHNKFSSHQEVKKRLKEAFERG